MKHVQAILTEKPPIIFLAQGDLSMNRSKKYILIYLQYCNVLLFVAHLLKCLSLNTTDTLGENAEVNVILLIPV